MHRQRRILLSNDDGVHARGLRVLAERLSSLGEIWVVAPDREQSGTSHSISLHRPLRMRNVAPREFAVDGTPTDSVYVALHHVLKEPPDLVVSGINHGPNLGNDVIYSGTVSAAMEAAQFGLRSIAVSLCLPDFRGTEPAAQHFDTAADVVAELAQAVLDRPMPRGVLLNVNVPNAVRDEVRGVKLCRLGFNDWSEAVSERADPRGRPYYWIGGQRAGHDNLADSDINAVAAGWASVTPIHYDLTDYRSFAYVRRLELASYVRAPDALGDAPLPHPIHPLHAADGSQSSG